MRKNILAARVHRLVMGLGCGVVGLALTACNKTSDDERRTPAQHASVSASTKAGPAPSAVSADALARPSEPAAADAGSKEYRLPAVPRLVAVGDLHGDIGVTRQVLELAGALGGDNWVGGKLVVVQTGDQLDRGDQERDIVDLLDRLRSEAEQAGGALHVLNGNHEVMNVAGDFRYVTQAGFRAFDGMKPEASGTSGFPREQRSRAAAFLPGGAMALRLARRPVVVQVGETVFAHAGVRAPHVDFGIDRLNREASAWMRGELQMPPRILQDTEGPTWTRIYGSPEPAAAECAVLEAALTRLGAKRMVVGHTVQPGGVAAGCSGKLQRIDVGLSHYYGRGAVQALEIVGDQLKVLSAPKR